jgi:hypothetical protein
LNKVKIVIKDNKTKLYIDDVEVDGLSSVDFSASVNNVPTLKIDIFTSELEIETETRKIEFENTIKGLHN